MRLAWMLLDLSDTGLGAGGDLALLLSCGTYLSTVKIKMRQSVVIHMMLKVH